MTPNSNPGVRPVEAILLVAGTGTRLHPLTESCPKCLLEVGGTPLLKRLLLQLQSVGIERVILSTGFCHDLLVEQVACWNLSMEIDSARGESYETENNAVSLGVAMEKCSSRQLLLCDGDIIVRHARDLEKLLASPGENVLTMIRFDSLGEEEMKLEVGADDRIQRLSKKLDPKTAHGESLGIQKIGPSAFSLLRQRLATLDEEERQRLYYEDVFSELIDEGIEFSACELPAGGWTEIDTIEDLQHARRMADGWEISEPEL